MALAAAYDQKMKDWKKKNDDAVYDALKRRDGNVEIGGDNALISAQLKSVLDRANKRILKEDAPANLQATKKKTPAAKNKKKAKAPPKKKRNTGEHNSDDDDECDPRDKQAQGFLDLMGQNFVEDGETCAIFKVKADAEGDYMCHYMLNGEGEVSGAIEV